MTISEAREQLVAQLEEAQQQLAQRQGGDKGPDFLCKSVEVELAEAFKAAVEAGASVKV